MQEGSEPEGLIFQGLLPVRWELPEQTLDDDLIAQLNEANESLLRVMIALDEHQPEWVEDSRGGGADLARLEFRLNLVLDMVGQLLAAQAHMPEPVRVRLTPETIEWEGPQPIAASTSGMVHVFLRPSYPRALVLPVEITASAPAESGHRYSARMEGVSEPVRDWLERLIFQRHRRAVAHRRR